MSDYRDWNETPAEVLSRLNADTLDAFLHASKCAKCGKYEVDAHHLNHKGAGGVDEFWNLIPLCRMDHSEWHQLGAVTFLKKYPHVWKRLKELGWELSLFTKRLTHKNMRRGE